MDFTSFLPTPSDKVFVGLGNPGNRYIGSRHNTGFLFIDLLEQALEAKLGSTKQVSSEDKKEYMSSKWQLDNGQNWILIKPQLYMNNSGEVVTNFFRYHSQYKTSDLIVAYDDLDLAVGDCKISYSKYPSTHNGISSIVDSLGQANSPQEFWHLRIGITGESKRLFTSGEDYVLSKFSPNESDAVRFLISDLIEQWLSIVNL